jgi:hypothetical protein
LLEQEVRDAYRAAVDMRARQLAERLPSDQVMEWVGDDGRRGWIIAVACRVHSSDLSPLARALILRFGAHGDAANALASRAQTTERAVPSLAGFFRAQMEKARVWAADREQEVAEWGKSCLKDLQSSYEEALAREEHEQREWG